ncbi:hypothetical protein AWB76_04912 [Caballeronia temeraria]|uniref:Uncharacterized protein n=1 Tax=Caballeronia temeraria TaxID=1777137 RepID=A0A158BZC9_9BURK|nr:hypothetical protein AWB76_04912 [Caballeronia temeraria]
MRSGRSCCVPNSSRQPRLRRSVRFLERISLSESSFIRPVTAMNFSINTTTAQLQSKLWTAARSGANAQPSPLTALATAGMNDVINTQGYTQAAWWNHIPALAWALMVIIGFFCNVLIGYGTRSSRPGRRFLMIMPLNVSISFTLIADIDSPRNGLIRVKRICQRIPS